MLCSLRECSRERFVAQVNGDAHESKAFVGDAVAATTGKLLDQTVGTEQLQQAADFGALATAECRAWGIDDAKAVSCVGVAEAVQGLVAVEHGLEQTLLLATERIEGAALAAMESSLMTSLIQKLIAYFRINDHGESVEITPCSLATDFRI